MTLRKFLWILSGLCTLALGTLGIFLPILPTVPLYLLTLFFFANSSARMHRWFTGSGLYKRYLLPYRTAGGLTKRAKTGLRLFVTVQLLIAAFLVRRSVVGLMICAAVYLGFLLSMTFAVKTVSLPPKKEEKKDE